MHSEARISIINITSLTEKLEKIEGNNNEMYEELKQAINDIDTKTFIASKKQEKDIKSITQLIENGEMNSQT